MHEGMATFENFGFFTYSLKLIDYYDKSHVSEKVYLYKVFNCFKKMKKKNILIIEDNEGDVFLIQEAFANLIEKLSVMVINDGRKAIDYLISIEEKIVDKPIHLIILDINLPRCSGFEILRYVKSHPRLASIPVVFLTSSSNNNDIISAMKLHANAFITKPIILDEFMKFVHDAAYFFTQVHSQLNYHGN